MKLIIFDLDQTLVDFISLHDEVTHKLFQKLFDVDARLTDIDFAGKSLTESLHQLARLKNVPEDLFQQKAQHLLENYEAAFGENIPQEASGYILPGVEDLLSELSKTDNVMALYTGDSPGIVGHVFKATGLGKFFRFCQYGTEVKSRADMVGLAIEKAEKLTGHEFKGRNVVIIGDSTRDIECGKQFNARTLAVSTGFHSVEELAKAGPDYLFKDLSDYRKVLEAIGNEH